MRASSRNAIPSIGRLIERNALLTPKSRPHHQRLIRLESTGYRYRSTKPYNAQGKSILKLPQSLYRPCGKSRCYSSEKETPQVLVNDIRHQEVLVAFNDEHTVRYPSFWLRDHCQCTECTHPHTKQRQLNTFSLDADIKATNADPQSDGLKIVWSQNDHTSLYPWSWLRQHVPFSPTPPANHARSDWQHVPPASPKYPTVDFDALTTSSAGLATILHQIRTYGFSFISNTPPTPEATQQLLERIAYIQVTHYGGFWDFTSEIKPIDTAYTNLSLAAHTDNTYYTDPCGLQLFHCLLPATKGGGQSTFIDGFAAATHLYKVNPDYYSILSSVRVVSHASGDTTNGSFTNTSVHSGGFPVFTHSVPHIRPHPKNISQIRWSNDDRHSSTTWPSHERMIMWYRAAKAWAEILESPEFLIEVQLQPGTPVIFDNWRVLHGRRAFEGERRVCGAYIGMDAFLAKASIVSGGGSQEIDTKEDVQMREQLMEEKVVESGDDGEGAHVLPQKDQGVNIPIAS